MNIFDAVRRALTAAAPDPASAAREAAEAQRAEREAEKTRAAVEAREAREAERAAAEAEKTREAAEAEAERRKARAEGQREALATAIASAAGKAASDAAQRVAFLASPFGAFVSGFTRAEYGTVERALPGAPKAGYLWREWSGKTLFVFVTADLPRYAWAIAPTGSAAPRNLAPVVYLTEAEALKALADHLKVA